MNIFPYWVQLKTTVDLRNGPQSIRCFGRSMVSEEDALRYAHERAERVQRRVQGESLPKTEDYSVDIREEIVRNLDSENIVTRNRNGVEVLNSSNLCFLDIDSPRWEWRDLFRVTRQNPAERKKRIFEQVELALLKPACRHLGFRIYETPRGVRLLVTGKIFDPRSAETAALMKNFHCDSLYAQLCRKQNCFRARLTPKSYRMKYRGHKVVFPRSNEEEKIVLETWLEGYERERQNFAACRFLRDSGPATMTPVIAFHDQRCNALTSLPLA